MDTKEALEVFVQEDLNYIALVLAAPNACALCGRDPRAHGNIFARPYGAHTWVRPSSDLVKARILSRRSS